MPSDSIRIKKAGRFVPDRSGREKSRRLIERVLRFYHVKPGKRDVNDFYYEYPVEEKTVLLSGLGRNINGSLRYILNELNHDPAFEGYRIYVRTTYENTDKEVNDAIKANDWNRTETVPRGFNRKLETCKYLLTESWFPYQYIRRPEQVVVNIWHGTPLKSLGLLRSGNKCHLSKMEQKNFLSADYLTYPNEYTRNILHDSYKVAPLLTAKSVMMGYPRTAGMLGVSQERKENLKSMLVPHGEKIYAYMPTFREYLTDEESIARESSFLGSMDAKLDDDEIMFVNLHHFHHRGKGLDYESYKHIRSFPDGVDTYELLSVTDALISDYSSVFMDYLILKRKVILYVEDYDRYNENQGLSLEIDKLPVDVARSPEEVISFLRDGKVRDTAEIQDLYRYDRKENVHDLTRLFLGDESFLDIRPETGTGADKILFYSEGFESEKETEALINAASGRDDPEIYVCCDEKKTDMNQDSVYPEIHDVRVIASDEEQPLSCYGKEVRELYRKGKIPFRLAMHYLKYDYAVMGARMFGHACFDKLVIYDTLDPEMIIGLALSENAGTKILCLSSSMIRELGRGNRELKTAVRYASKYCGLTVVFDGSLLSYAKKLTGVRDIASLDGSLEGILTV